MSTKVTKPKKTNPTIEKATEFRARRSTDWALLVEGIERPIYLAVKEAPVYLAIKEQLDDYLKRVPSAAFDSVIALFALAVEAAATLKRHPLTEEAAVATVRELFHPCPMMGELSVNAIVERHLTHRAAVLKRHLRQHPEAGVARNEPSNTRTMSQFHDIMLALARERFGDELKDSASTEPEIRQRPARRVRNG